MFLRHHIRFLICMPIFFMTHSSHEKIELYMQLVGAMQKYLNAVEEHMGSRKLGYNDTIAYDEAALGLKVSSDFICSCINSCNLPKDATIAIKSNAYMQLALATYGLIQGFVHIWSSKQQKLSALLALKYTDMMVQFPNLVLIEYQIKIMRLLIDMNMHGSLPEKIFGHIQIVSIIIPGPSRRYTKKSAKKLFQRCFDKQGKLVHLASLDELTRWYRLFDDKVNQNLRDLVLKSSRYPVDIKLFFTSKFNSLVQNEYNHELLQIIEMKMHNIAFDCSASNTSLMRDLCNFYCL